MDLCEKYRPRDFAGVLGNETTIQSLKTSIEKEKELQPLTIFSGPSGVGKTTLARICAYAIGCPDDEDHIRELNGASTNGVDDMRALVESVAYRTMDGKPRVIVIDEAHRVTKQAFDSILKPTEKPPANTYWILCSTEPSKFPEAIRTRANHYALTKVSATLIFKLLESIAEKEKIGLDRKIITFIATKSEGSPRRALKSLAGASGLKTIEEVKELLQSSDIEESKTAIDLARLIIKGGDFIKEALPLLNQLKEEGETIRLIILAYFSKVALNCKDQSQAERAISVMYKFSVPCNPSEKLAPIIIATANCLMA